MAYVSDDDLPAGHDWTIVRTRTETFLFVKATEVSAELLTRIWRRWQRLDGSGERRECFPPPGVVR